MPDASHAEAPLRNQANDSGVSSLLHHAARQYAANGVAVFPCLPRGKRPITTNGFHEATTDIDQIDTWWTDNPDANIGIDLGTNQVFTLDVDGPSGQAVLDELVDTYEALPDTYQVVTGRKEGGGRHHIFHQPTEGAPLRSTKLGHPKLEIKGAGGYVIAPPSVHESGNTYTPVGKWADIVDAPGWLIAIARRDQEPAQQPIEISYAELDDRYGTAALRNIIAKLTATPIGYGLRHDAIRDAAMQLASIVKGGHLTEGTAYAALIGGCAAIQRPQPDDPREVDNLWRGALDKAQPHSAAPLEPLNVTPTLTDPPTPIDFTYRETSSDTPDVPRGAPWDATDLTDILAGNYEPPQTTVLARATDGVSLLYPAATNAIFGESESGKSWVALHATAQQLNAGRSVIYIDFEASAPVIVSRLLSLGVPTQPIAERFAYINPDAPLDQTSQDRLHDALRRLQPELVVLDGITGAMGLHGWNPLDNADAERFDRLLPRPLATAGASVLMVDHVTKTRAEGSEAKYAMGAQHKRAAITGAAYRVDAVPGHQLAPGRHGKLRISIAKDRHGAVRAEHPTQAGTFHLDSTDPEQPRAHIEPPPNADKPFRPTGLMEKVSRLLEGSTEPLTKTEIARQVGGKKTYALQAIDVLIREGFVREQKTSNGDLCTGTRPYRDEES